MKLIDLDATGQLWLKGVLVGKVGSVFTIQSKAKRYRISLYPRSIIQKGTQRPSASG